MRHSVAGNVEAGGVGQVIDIEGVLEAKPLAERRNLDQRGIGAFLEGLAEDIALAGGEAGFEGIGCGDGAAQPAGREQRQSEAVGLQGRLPSARSPCTGGVSHCVLGRAARRQRHDRVGDAIRGRVVDAADGAGVIDDAIRLAALQHGIADQRPAVGDLAFERVLVGESGNLDHIVEADDVRAVEVRRAIRAAQIERIVAVEEEAQPALLVEGVRPGIRASGLNTVADVLLNMRLERVIGIDSCRLVRDRLRRIADIGHAQIDVAALIIGLVGDGSGGVHRCSDDVVTVAVILLVGTAR